MSVVNATTQARQVLYLAPQVAIFASLVAPEGIEAAELGSMCFCLADGLWYQKTTAYPSATGWTTNINTIGGGGGGIAPRSTRKTADYATAPTDYLIAMDATTGNRIVTLTTLGITADTIVGVSKVDFSGNVVDIVQGSNTWQLNAPGTLWFYFDGVDYHLFDF